MQLKSALSTTVGRTLLLGGILSILCCALWWTSPIRELDLRVADSWYRWKKDKPSNKVVLVLIDDRSLERYGRWPWSRSLIADLINRVSEGHPRAIGLDILLSEPESKIADERLATALKTAGNVALVDKISDSKVGSLWVEPIPQLSSVAVGVGHAQSILDSDGVCRRFPLAEMSMDGPRFAFGLLLAGIADPAGATAFKGVYESVQGQPIVSTNTAMDSVAPILVAVLFRAPP